MRVLLDAHQIGRQQTGNETYVRELLPLLCASPGVQVVAAVDNDLACAYAELSGADLFAVPRNPATRIVALAAGATRHRADLVHSIYYPTPGVRRPTVVTIHDISYEIHPEFFGAAALLRNRTLIRLAARVATVVVTVSETSRQDIVDRYSIEDSKVVAIHNGVSPIFHSSGNTQRPSDGRLRVLAVGTLQPRKNLLRLVDAVRVVAAKQDVLLRVVGPDGYQASEIRSRMGQVAWVETTGYLETSALAQAYQEADVFVYPSIYEGFGLPVVEAMASGTPVITTTGGSLPEIAGDAALLVDPLNVEQMADAIQQIANDSGLRERLRSRGIERAAEFSWIRSASEHVRVYKTALESPRHGPSI